MKKFALPTVLFLLAACSNDASKPSDPDNNTNGDGSGDVTPDSGRPSLDAGKTQTSTGSVTKADASTTHSDGGSSPDAAVNRMDAATQVDSGNTTSTTKSTGPGDWVAGDYPPNITSSTFLEIANLPGSNGNVRQYKVHVPKGYDSSKPAPVLYCLHGLGQDAVSFCVNSTGMPAKSDAEGFILVMPNGLSNSWDAGTCCSNQGLNEPEFIRSVFTEISKHLNIDLGRVYATGLSNGGYLSYRIACEMSDLFVGVAPGSGAVGIPSIGGGVGFNTTFTKCEPTQKVSVLDMHGTADPLIPYSLQKPSLELFAKSNGCSLTTAPATVPMSGGDTTCVTYSGCPTGIEVTGCTVQGGGHCWFGDPTGSCGTGAPGIGNAIVGADSKFLNNTDAAWAFLSRLSR